MMCKQNVHEDASCPIYLFFQQVWEAIIYEVLILDRHLFQSI